MPSAAFFTIRVALNVVLVIVIAIVVAVRAVVAAVSLATTTHHHHQQQHQHAGGSAYIRAAPHTHIVLINNTIAIVVAITNTW